MQEENMSEKGDELLQAAVAQDGTMAAGENAKNQYLLLVDIGEGERREIQLYSYYISQLCGDLWYIYRGYYDGVLLCVLDLNDKWLFIALKIPTVSITIVKEKNDGVLEGE